MPLAISSALRSSFAERSASPVGLRHPLFELSPPPEVITRQRPSRTGHCPRTDTSHGLSALFSTSGSEGPLAAGVACPLRSAPRVWLPSRRLTPFDASPVLFHTDSAREICPSKHSPLPGYRRRFHREAPTYRLPQRSLPLAHGPARCSPVSGLCPLPESLAPRHVFSTPEAGGSHGLLPSRVSRSATLTRISPDLLSRA